MARISANARRVANGADDSMYTTRFGVAVQAMVVVSPSACRVMRQPGMSLISIGATVSAKSAVPWPSGPGDVAVVTWISLSSLTALYVAT